MTAAPADTQRLGELRVVTGAGAGPSRVRRRADWRTELIRVDAPPGGMCVALDQIAAPSEIDGLRGAGVVARP